MPDDMDWLLRPVVEGLLKYESLIGHEIGLYDVALLNDALDVRQENDRRVRANQANGSK